MFRKALFGLVIAVVIASTAFVFAQFRGTPPGGRPPRPGGGGSAPALQLSSVTDMDVSGNFLYILTGDWVHQIRLGANPNLRQSADIREPLAEARRGQGQVSVGSDARIRVSDGNVLILTRGALVEFNLNLTRAQVRPMGPAMREAMEVQRRARAQQGSRSR